MANHSQIVIGPDGTVLAAIGEVPPGLVDKPLADCASLPPAVRAAGAVLLQQLRISANRLASQMLHIEGAETPVELVAIEALGIRRTASDLRGMPASKLDAIVSQAEAAGVTVSVKVADDVPVVVHVDPDKLAWAVTTLVGNALRYVQAPSRRFGGKAIGVRASFDPVSSEITIEVQDDGPGIPAETVRRIFQRDGLNVRGSGLALLLVREIMVAHGGTVDFRSSTDPHSHGTTILLRFPTR